MLEARARVMLERPVTPRIAALGVGLVLALALVLVGCARPLGPAGHDLLGVGGERAARTDPISLPDRVWYTVALSRAAKAAAPPRASADERVLVLPMEFEGDNGAANGDANLLRLLPAYEWPVRSTWRIQHLDMIVLAHAPGGITGAPGNPEPVGGPRTFGLADITHVSFFAPESPGPLLVGVGGALGIPTATDEVLGSGKWSAGPALRLTYRKAPWTLGFMAAQRWSFAGNAARAEVNQLLMRGAFRHQLGNDWFLLSAPIITANWNAAPAERWLLPLGGGIGRTFDLAGRPWAASLQGYANVLRPTGAPTWSVRLNLTAFLPLGP